MTLSKFRPEDSQFCNDLLSALLSGNIMLCACELIQTLVCKGKTVIIVLKILDTTVGAQDCAPLVIMLFNLLMKGLLPLEKMFGNTGVNM